MTRQTRGPRPPATPDTPNGAHPLLDIIGEILDESRDFLDVALDRSTGLESLVRRAEQHTRELHWDASKILLDSDPSRPAMRAVLDSGDQLLTDLRRGQGHAEDLKDTLRQAGRHLEHATPLVLQLTGATQDPEHAAAAALLATRLERLATLIEMATPLAERTATRIEQAHQALETGLMQTGDRIVDPFRQFWNVDWGIFGTDRALAHARASATNGTDLTQHAVTASTVTAAHTRDISRQSRHSPTTDHRPTQTRPAHAPGPSI